MSRITFGLSLAVPRTCIHQPQLGVMSSCCRLCLQLFDPNIFCTFRAHDFVAMDPFSAVQVAASIVQCIDVGVRVLQRLKQFHSKAGALPQAFENISKRLPIFIVNLRQIKLTLDYVPDDARKALRPAIDECSSYVLKLEGVVDLALPKLDDSSVTKSWKAVVSVKHESDIRNIEKVIKEYMEIFAQYQTSSLAIQSFTRRSPICPNSPEPVKLT